MGKTQWVKLFSLLVALLLFVSAMVGCGAQKETEVDGVKEDESSSSEDEGSGGDEPQDTPSEEKPKEVEITFLHCWNGGALSRPRPPGLSGWVGSGRHSDRIV